MATAIAVKALYMGTRYPYKTRIDLDARHEFCFFNSLFDGVDCAVHINYNTLSIRRGVEPIPTMFTLPSVTLATTTQIFVVPISSPTRSPSSMTILTLPFLDYGALFKPSVYTLYQKTPLLCIF